MIAAFDVHYLEDCRASAAAVLFSDYGDAEPAAIFTRCLPVSEPYIPGAFYKRELPCLLGLLKEMHTLLDEMVVDGYVMLGNKPGLGRHLYESFHGWTPVIGVAKSRFEGSSGAEVFRGESLRPLYVTSAGVDQGMACDRIRRMHGSHRIPTLLKRVDLLARGNAYQ